MARLREQSHRSTETAIQRELICSLRLLAKAAGTFDSGARRGVEAIHGFLDNGESTDFHWHESGQSIVLHRKPAHLDQITQLRRNGAAQQILVQRQALQ